MKLDIKFERMIAEQPIYKHIINIIEEPFKEKEKKPRIIRLADPTFREMVVVDLPRHEELYHGTTFSMKCNDNCYLRGDIVVPRDEEEIMTDKIERLDCNVTSVHHHPESILASVEGKEIKERKTSHVHFECDKKSYDNTLEFAKFIRNL